MSFSPKHMTVRWVIKLRELVTLDGSFPWVRAAGWAPPSVNLLIAVILPLAQIKGNVLKLIRACLISANLYLCMYNELCSLRPLFAALRFTCQCQENKSNFGKHTKFWEINCCKVFSPDLSLGTLISKQKLESFLYVLGFKLL